MMITMTQYKPQLKQSVTKPRVKLQTTGAATVGKKPRLKLVQPGHMSTGREAGFTTLLGEQRSASAAAGAARATRDKERARCARVVKHGIEVGRVIQAGIMAFDMDISARAAIDALDVVCIDARKPLSLGAGGDGQPLTVAQRIIMAGKHRRGEA